MKKVTAMITGLLMLISVLSTAYASNYETEVERGVHFRSSPSTESYIYRMIPTGEDIHVIGKVNNYWLKIKAQDGKIGYISANSKFTTYNGSSRNVKESSKNTSGSKADAIIATAKSLIGQAEYNYGTRDHNRLILDCSSYTEYIFEKNGISLKWGTRYQKDAGKYVSKSNLRKGDLVFFSTSNSSEIGHVGIYISDGKFINILDKKQGSDVHIANLNSGFWESHYVTARRVID